MDPDTVAAISESEKKGLQRTVAMAAGLLSSLTMAGGAWVMDEIVELGNDVAGLRSDVQRRGDISLEREARLARELETLRQLTEQQQRIISIQSDAAIADLSRRISAAESMTGVHAAELRHLRDITNAGASNMRTLAQTLERLHRTPVPLIAPESR